ncbi:hypothetical protein J6590_022317 [Homalodisca vitripennis]|nr:hypothetical protein J6590_022317 [Homalodisca vitripennis]
MTIDRAVACVERQGNRPGYPWLRGRHGKSNTTNLKMSYSVALYTRVSAVFYFYFTNRPTADLGTQTMTHG